MPRRSLPDFDAGALCTAVLEQDIGLTVTTNDPQTFKRKMYEHMARNPSHKLSILSDPDSAYKFLIVRRSATSAGNLPETHLG